jgi:hypothetical protein
LSVLLHEPQLDRPSPISPHGRDGSAFRARPEKSNGPELLGQDFMLAEIGQG